MRDMTQNTTPYCFLTEEEQEAIREAEEIEYLGYLCGWYPTDIDPDQSASYVYRIKPATKDVIPWDSIDPKWKYAARDRDRLVYLYTKKPFQLSLSWDADIPSECVRLPYDLLSGIEIGTCGWKDSLQERPE